MNRGCNERVKLVQDILVEALEIDEPQKRTAFLVNRCGTDLALRKEVEELLQAAAEAGPFLPDLAAECAQAAMLTALDPIGASLPALEVAGDRIVCYRLLEKLGEGGFGIVYMAEQEEPIRRRVAIKIIKLGMDTRQVVARFKAEQQALALMDHPNIAKVFDAGATKTGRPFFVMELVQGIKITRYCTQNRLSTHQRIELLIQVCQAVQHAHQKGIIHRDLKPSNILVSMRDGVTVPKVIDFGVAKATSGHLIEQTLATSFEQLIGTPAYMSPEQAAFPRVDVDTRSDIYSLGALMYELLTETPPFDPKRSSSLEDFRRKVLETQPTPPSMRLRGLATAESTNDTGNHHAETPRLMRQLRNDLDSIAMKCLEKQPARRYQTAKELADELGSALRGEPIVARSIGTAGRAWRWCQRKPVVASLGATTAFLLLTITIGSPIAAVRIEQARQRVQRNIVRQYVANGNRLVEEGDLITALPWFAKALNEDQDPGRRGIHQLRLASAIQQCPRLLQAWFHNDTVIDAQFSPDGRWVLTAGEEGEAHVWDVETGTAVSPVLHLNGRLRHAQFAPDGLHVAAASEKSCAGVWKIRTGELLFPLLEQEHPGFFVNFSQDGQRMVTGGVDAVAQVWNAYTGQKLGPSMKHQSDVHWAAFSPDGNLIVTRSGERTVRVWNAKTGEPVSPPLSYRVAGHNPELGPDSLRRTCEFSPDSRLIAIPCGDGTARICEATTGRELAVLRHRGDVRRACFSPNGHWVVTASDDGRGQVWDVQTATAVGSQLKHIGPVFDASFSRDSRQVVTASSDGTARVWDAATGAPLGAAFRHLGAVWRASFSPDGTKIITASADHTARVWEVRSAGLEHHNVKHPGVVQKARFSPDSRRVVTIAVDGTAKVWELATGLPVTAFPQGLVGVRDAQFSLNQPWLATATTDGTARIWDIGTGETISPPMVQAGMVNHVALSSDSKRLLTAGSDRRARIWGVPAGTIIKEMSHRESVNYAAFTSDQKRVVTVSLSAPVLFYAEGGEHWAFDPQERVAITADWTEAQLWDARTGRALTPPRKLGTWVSQIALSPDGFRAVTGCSPRALTQNYVCVIDLPTGRQVGRTLVHRGGVIYSEFSPDGKMIVTCSWDHTARVWDAATGQPLSPWLVHQKSVHCAAFSPDSRLVATASEDGTARVWDAATGDAVTPPLKHAVAVHRVFFSPDGRWFLTASVDGDVAVWELSRKTIQDDVLLARVLAGHVIDQTGGIQPLSVEDMKKAWLEQRTHLPDRQWSGRTETVAPTTEPEAAAARERLENCLILGEQSREHSRSTEDALLRAPAVTGNEWASLAEQWSRTIAVEPEQSSDYRHRSLIYERLGQYRSAVKDMREYLWKRGPAPAAQLDLSYLQLGEMHLRLGEIDKADADFKNVLETSPEDSDYLTYYWHALAQEHFGNFRQAIDEFSGAIRRFEPNTGGRRTEGLIAAPQFYFDRAQNYLRLRDYSDARHDLELAIQINPDDVKNYLELASSYLFGPPDTRSPEQALALALKAARISQTTPDRLETWSRLWQFLYLDAEPTRPKRSPLNTLGIAYYRSGQFDEAVRTLKAMLETEAERPNAAQTLMTLALSYQRLGDSAQARECFARAIELWPAIQRLSALEQTELVDLRHEAQAVLGQPRTR